MPELLQLMFDMHSEYCVKSSWISHLLKSSLFSHLLKPEVASATVALKPKGLQY